MKGADFVLILNVLTREDHSRVVGLRKASDNIVTGGAISPPPEQIAPPVTDVCPSSEKLKFC